MTDPQTPAEWQEAVDGAHACLMLDSARQYGLVMGGPRVNVDRCEQVLAAGAALGVRPRPDAVERFVSALNSNTCREGRRGKTKVAGNRPKSEAKKAN